MMATPIRKKRNFKALQLDVVQPVAAPEPEPVPTRLAPVAAGATGGKRRPPPMTLKAPKIPAASNAEPESDLVVSVANNGPNSAPPTGSVSARRMTYHTNLANTLANLDMNAEVKFDLRNEDLKDLQELGQGNGGSVKKVEHLPTNTIMAKKVCALSGYLVLDIYMLIDIVGYCPTLTFILRLSSSMPSLQYENRYSANYKSCMTAIQSTSFRSTAHFYPSPISASVWSSRTRDPWMGYTRRSAPLILM